MDREFELVDRDGYVHLFKTTSGALATCPEEHHTSFNEEYTADGSGNIAATTIITPTSGKKVSVHAYHLNTDGATGSIALDFLTSTIKVERMYPAKSAVSDSSMAHDEGDTDEVLTLTATGIGNGAKVFVKVQYVEEE